MVAWFIGRRAGIWISCAAAASWLLAELLAGSSYSHPAIPLWNTLVRLSFFLIVTYILSTLRIVRENQESLTHFVVHDLRSPLSVILPRFEHAASRSRWPSSGILLTEPSPSLPR
jgi:signal transduction histidine kinase